MQPTDKRATAIQPNKHLNTEDVRVLAEMSLQEGEVTALLDAWSEGDRLALDHLIDVVHGELHKMARGLFRGERKNHTLQPTAVVNEVYLKLKGQRRVNWRGRAEFFCVAARLMRRILVDHARRHRAEKRGGGVPKIPLEDILDQAAPADILALDDALLDLGRLSERQVKVVEMKVITGLTLAEIATAEGVSPSTISREWSAAQLFLKRHLRRS